MNRDKFANRLYRATRMPGLPDTATVEVYVSTGRMYFLNPRLDLANHSPDGFQWGYAGSGPAQLALALLADAADDETARGLYQIFKQEIVAKIDDDSWRMTSDEINLWITRRTECEHKHS